MSYKMRIRKQNNRPRSVCDHNTLGEVNWARRTNEARYDHGALIISGP